MNEDCDKLCEQIRACLVEERRALVCLDAERLSKETLKKESFLNSLARFQPCEAIRQLKETLEAHDEFLKHSLRNLANLESQLKTLVGETPLYSPK